MKRILVTGSTSMIGVALINECIQNGVHVCAIVRKGTGRIGRLPKSNLIDIVECDMDDLLSLDISKAGSCDVFYHFAWANTDKATRDDPICQLKNIQYTMDAVELAKKIGCKKFIGAGSQAEYGIINDKIYSNAYANPIISYGIAKYAAGKLSKKQCEKYGMTHIWGRIFSVYGINDNNGTLIKYALEKFYQGEVAKFSSATQNWNYLNEIDAGKIFYLLGNLVHKDKIYNIASLDTRPLKEYILDIKSCFDENARCEFVKSNSQNVVSLDPDITDLIEDIGWQPEISFKEYIKKNYKLMLGIKE